MNKKNFVLAVCLMLVSVLAIPVFAAYTGSGSVNDPFVLTHGLLLTPDSVTYPVYIRKDTDQSVFGYWTNSVSILADSVYYIYTPYTSEDISVFLETNGGSAGERLAVDATLVRTDSRYKVYSFVAPVDGYGVRLVTNPNFGDTYIFSDALYDSASVAQWGSAFLETSLSVGSSLLSFVLSSWLPLVCLASFVLVAVLGVSRKLIKGV